MRHARSLSPPEMKKPGGGPAFSYVSRIPGASRGADRVTAMNSFWAEK
jgi:hypothetical protein